MRYLPWAIAACLIAALVAEEQAAGAPISLYGQQVRVSIATHEGVYAGPLEVTAAPGTEISEFVELTPESARKALQIDIGDDTIRIDVVNNIKFNQFDFNGLVFELVAPDEVSDFANVFIESGGLPGFDASRLSFTADSVFLNFSDLFFDVQQNGSSSMVLKLEPAAAIPVTTPEPASVLLWTLGAAGMGWSALRRRSRH